MSLIETLAMPMERLRIGFARSRAAVFLRWWGGQLWEWLPASVQAWLRAGRARLWVGVDGQLVAGMPQPEGQAMARAAVWLLVPTARVLRRRLRYPAAAMGRIDDLIRHEVDRQTPFRADECHAAWRVLPGPAAGGQVEVELVVIPRTGLEQSLRALEGASARLEGVDVADADGQPLGVNLLPREQRFRRRDPWAHWRIGLAGALALLVVFGLWQSLENRRIAVQRIEAAVDQQRDEARRAAAMRGQLEDAVDGGAFLARHRASKVSVVVLLDELSRGLPDDTWLERLSFNQGQVRLTGFSTEVAAIIGQLQQSSHLSSPGLVGSVQSDPQTGRDRFTVVAQAVTREGAHVGADKE